MTQKGFMNLPLALGMGILGGLRPSRAPQNFFTSIGPGLAQGLQMYAASQPKPQSELEKLRIAQIRAQMAASAKLAENNKALLESLPPKERALAQAMGPGEWAKTLVANRNKTPEMVSAYNSKTRSPQYVDKSLIGTPGYEHFLPMQAKPPAPSGLTQLAEVLTANETRIEPPKLNKDHSLIVTKNADGSITYTSKVVAGSKADLENQQKKLGRYEQGFAYAQTLDRAKQRFNMMEEKVESALQISTDDEETTMGLMGRIFAKVPGTQAYTLENYLDSLRAMSGLDQLNQMRLMAQASGSTGSGLGQVTEREHKLLQQQWANLDPASKNFKEELKRYMQSAKGALKRVQKAFDARVKIGSFNKDFLEKYNEFNADQGAVNTEQSTPQPVDSGAQQSSADPKTLTEDQLRSLPDDQLRNILSNLSTEQLEALKVGLP